MLQWRWRGRRGRPNSLPTPGGKRARASSSGTAAAAFLRGGAAGSMSTEGGLAAVAPTAAPTGTRSLRGASMNTAWHFGQRTLSGFAGTFSSDRKYFAAQLWHWMIITHHSVGSRTVVPSRSPRAPVIFPGRAAGRLGGLRRGAPGLGSNYHARKDLPRYRARRHSDLPRKAARVYGRKVRVRANSHRLPERKTPPREPPTAPT